MQGDIPVIEDNAVGVAALGGGVIVSPVLAIVGEHAARAVLVIANVAQLALAAGAHKAADAGRLPHCEV